MSEGNAGLWEAVRRALGRLVSAVRVRDLDSVHLAPSLGILGDSALAPPVCDAGGQEPSWKPTASLLMLSSPQAGAGGAGADLAAVAAVIGLNAALSPQATPVWASPPLAAGVTVHRLSVLYGPALSPSVHDAPVLFSHGAVHTSQARLNAPAVVRPTAEAPRLPKRPLFAAPRSGRGGEGPLPFAGVRVRSGMAACAEAPLVRARRAPPAGLRDAQAFAAERRQLAQAAQAALDDVILLGVYPMVPVAAVRRLALGEDGRALSLWLKPEALSAALAGREPRLVTLIVGRLRSTGRMIQAVG